MITQEVAYLDSVFGFAANKHDILFHEICSYTQLQGVRLAYAVVIHLHAAQQLLALHIEAGNAPPLGDVEVKQYGELRRCWLRCSRRRKLA